jgi:hypothetical protein
VTATDACIGGIELERRPKLGWVDLSGRKIEAARHDAYHRAGVAIEADVTVENGRVAAEGALPEIV